MTKDIKRIAQEYSKKDSMIDSGNLFWALTEAIKIIEELEQKKEWRPIETAPKDGTLVLVINGEKGGYLTEPCQIGTAFFGLASYEDEAWSFEWKSNACCDEVSSYIPTHWMPLPKPPILKK